MPVVTLQGMVRSSPARMSRITSGSAFSLIVSRGRMGIEEVAETAIDPEPVTSR